MYHQLVGELQVFPLHTIILDRTDCRLPDLSTVAPPPAPTALPPPVPDSSSICHGFYEAIRQNNTVPFICKFLLGTCDLGVTCTLFLFGFSYQMNVSINATAEQYFIFSVADETGRGLEGDGRGTQVSVTLPSPTGTVLLFNQTSISNNIKGFQVR